MQLCMLASLRILVARKFYMPFICSFFDLLSRFIKGDVLLEILTLECVSEINSNSLIS